MLIGPLLQREDGVVASAKIAGGAIGILVQDRFACGGQRGSSRT
jgi:hypothetical protein